MRPFNRLDAPDFLTDNWETWGNEYTAQKIANPSYAFNWKQHQGQPFSRQREWKSYEKQVLEEPNDYAFRFLFD